MSEISPIGPGHAGSATRAALNGQPVREVPYAAEETAGRTGDTVELSDRARLLEHAHGLGPVREDLVDSLRSAIDRGEYPTDDQLERAIDRLIADLTA